MLKVSVVYEMFKNIFVKLLHAAISVVRVLNFFFTLVCLTVVDIFL